MLSQLPPFLMNLPFPSVNSGYVLLSTPDLVVEFDVRARREQTKQLRKFQEISLLALRKLVALLKIFSLKKMNCQFVNKIV